MTLPVLYHKSPQGRTLAYRMRDGMGPGLIFLGGFQSNMDGLKAQFFDQWCARKKLAYLRFDYSGHGRSSGLFEDGTIGQWLEDALAMYRLFNRPAPVLVGSSMGGWISLLLARRPDVSCSGLLTLACATDFTRRVIEPALTPQARDQLHSAGRVTLCSDYAEDPTIITRELLSEALNHQLLASGESIAIDCPVYMIHGLDDQDIPWQTSLDTLSALATQEGQLSLLKGGDHRLSSPGSLEFISRIAELALYSGTNAQPKGDITELG